MCDSDKSSKTFFAKHIDLMKKLGQDPKCKYVEDIDDFFETLNEQK